MASIDDIMQSQEDISQMEYDNFLSPSAVEATRAKENPEFVNKILINAIRSRDIWKNDKFIIRKKYDAFDTGQPS